MRKAVTLLLAILFLTGMFLASARSKAGPAPLPQTRETLPGVGFRITLGVADEKPRDWSGRLALSAGRVVRIEGWQFAGDDAVSTGTAPQQASWQTASKQPMPSRQANVSTPPLVEPLHVLATGVEGVISAPNSAQVTITTPQGNFRFTLQELAYGRPLRFADGAAMVERQPVTARLTTPELEDDHPSITVARDGAVWVAWIGYRDRADRVLVRSLKNGKWSEPEIVSAGNPERMLRVAGPEAAAPAIGGDHFRTAIAEDAGGRIWVVWSAQQNGNWELAARSRENGKWSATTRLTNNPGPDIFHSLAADRQGRLALAWMSFRGGQFDIFLKTLEDNRWSDEIKVSDSAANDWEPAVAMDSTGRAWVTWDSYERGSYNVLLRGVSAGQHGEVVRVTDSDRYHARASVAADSRDRVWVAWEESEANWGKDYGYWVNSTPFQRAGNPIYRSRSVRVAVLDNNTLKTPEHELMAAAPAALRQYVQMPQLLAGADGRVWALVRVRTFVRTETSDVWASGGRWNAYLTAYQGGRWQPLVPVPDSVARNSARGGAAIAPDGKVWAVWPTDQRLFGNPPRVLPAAANLPPRTLQGFGAVPQNYEVVAGVLDPAGFDSPAAAASAAAATRSVRSGSAAEFVRLRPDLAAAAPVHPDEEADVRRIRAYEIRSGGKVYKIYRGDMHRHTDISADGAGDGSVLDMFRYALDGARMDYAMVTDHQSGFDQEYSWWRIEKADDLFHVPGFFTTLFGYERSLGYPNGHRNLAFAQRGVRTLPAAAGEQPQQGEAKVNTGSVLYPYLRQNRGIAFGHTSHTGMGTDWRDNDPEVEPLVEIYQGMRTSAEYEGAPKSPTADKPATHQGGFRPLGFIWNAWAKGYKLGVQASSDHISTHISYSCVISEDRSREGLMNAMRRRHAYAATDNIILDVRMRDNAAEYIQGDAFTANGPARMVVKVIGTRPIKDVQVIRNNRSVYNQKPGAREAEFSFVDTESRPGESYYYVRVQQDDDQIAWSSPIWVTRN